MMLHADTPLTVMFLAFTQASLSTSAFRPDADMSSLEVLQEDVHTAALNYDMFQNKKRFADEDASLIAVATSEYVNGTTASVAQLAPANLENFHFAYRLLDGLDTKVGYCDLVDGTDLEALPSTAWRDVSVELPYLKTGQQYQYSWVPGDRFKYENNPATFGFCYKSSGDLVCVCNLALLKGDAAPPQGGWLADEMKFKGCNDMVSEAEVPSGDGEPTEMTIRGFATRGKWVHPATLWVEGFPANHQWCALTAELSFDKENSLPHALPYCVAIEYQKAHPEQIAGSGKDASHVLYYMYWAMSFDENNAVGWFAAKQPRFTVAWKKLKDALSGGPTTFSKDSPSPTGVQTEAVLTAGDELCTALKEGNPAKFALLGTTYDNYMTDVLAEQKEVGFPPAGRKPAVVFAGGPPSAGKSITSMSTFDYELIQTLTTSGGEHALMDRSYEHFQAATVELNVDRIVETTTLLKSMKSMLSVRSEFVEATMSKDETDKMNKLKQDDGQREYWFLRKALGVDDLSNAHIQRSLALGVDVIYETLIGNGWVDWGLKFEIPKMKAAGYEIVLVDYVVPVNELVRRAFEREKKTGQTPAPAKQIEADAIAAPTNFMKPSLLGLIDYAVSMSHVKRGEAEDALAVFSKGCFTHCAEGEVMDSYDASMLRRCVYQKCA